MEHPTLRHVLLGVERQETVTVNIADTDLCELVGGASAFLQILATRKDKIQAAQAMRDSLDRAVQCLTASDNADVRRYGQIQKVLLDDINDRIAASITAAAVKH